MLTPMDRERWQTLAAAQGGLITRAQFAALGVDRWAIRHRLESGRWIDHSPVVIGTTTGELTRAQLMWLGVLHAGGDSLVGELTAAEVGGLRGWHRDHVTVMVTKDTDIGRGFPGIEFRRTRRPLPPMRRPASVLPLSRIEPAVLHFASRQRVERTAEGVLAAAVQQRLTSAELLTEWIDRMRPLRWAERFRQSLIEVGGGAGSAAEIDVRRMCRNFGLKLPQRQVRRRDSSGRLRFTDCEWTLPDGRTLVLEVDGGFHMDVEHWEDDIARQRGLTSPHRMVVRCTARELRDEPEAVARDLRLLGVPAA
jgi:hypothetical protein